MAHIVVRGRTQPDQPAERQEQQRRALRAAGWDYSRAVEHLAKRRREDAQGRKQIDLR